MDCQTVTVKYNPNTEQYDTILPASHCTHATQVIKASFVLRPKFLEHADLTILRAVYLVVEQVQYLSKDCQDDPPRAPVSQALERSSTLRFPRAVMAPVTVPRTVTTVTAVQQCPVSTVPELRAPNTPLHLSALNYSHLPQAS